MFAKMREVNRRRRLILHHDNGISHTSAQTRTFLSIQDIDLMGHSPHSPDFAPNDSLFSRRSKINFEVNVI